MEWISVKIGLPVTDDKHGESSEVQCYDAERWQQYVGYYNSTEKCWRVYHSVASNDAVRCDFWKPLEPNPPSPQTNKIN